jgi:Rrf2 family transcriptional regulator, nitric oxide-sensitive transcriptional repressor
MISQTTEYALRAVVYLAQCQGKPSTAVDIAKAIRVPVGYLQKVLRMLSRSKILVAQRGTGGGFTLAKLPTAIRVLDVLNATDCQMERIENCPLGIKGHTSLCALHQLLDEQMAQVERTFATTSIADLIRERNGIRPLCDTNATTPLSIGVSGREQGQKNGEKPTID